MKDQSKKTAPTSPPDPQGKGEVLAKLPVGDYDTGLEQAPGNSSQGDIGSARVRGLGGLHKPEQSSTTSPAPVPSAPGDEQLALPDGGIVAMRRSGGFRFTSRQVTVYQDGTVEAKNAAPGSRKVPTTWKLRDKELASLYRLLDAAGLPELPPVSGQQSPDGMAYEIEARIGQDVYSIETFDGSIPEPLAPLIQTLTSFMRSRRGSTAAKPQAPTSPTD